MEINKLIGWFLLFLGIIIIGSSLISSIAIFTGKTTPPEIFTFPEKEEVKEKDSETFMLEGKEINMEEVIQDQIKEIIPVESLVGHLPTLFNMVSWSIFMGILIFGGSQISVLGIKLIKK